MRQKVLISAAMLHDPSVLVLDEPLTGLDVESVILTKCLLTSLAANGKAVLYSSHVLDVVERFCGRVLIIDQGKMIADGSPDELKARTNEANLEGVFRDLTHSADAEPRVKSIIDTLRT
jgi:ABC-2 type transport system ATP-binding protein